MMGEVGVWSSLPAGAREQIQTLLRWSRGSSYISSWKMDLRMHKLLLHLVSYVLVDSKIRYTEMSITLGCISSWMVSVIHAVCQRLLSQCLVVGGWVTPTLLLALQFSASFMPALWGWWNSRSGVQQAQSGRREGKRCEALPAPIMPSGWDTWAVLAISSRDLCTPPMDSTLCVSPSVICLRLSFCSFSDLFLLTHTKKSMRVVNCIKIVHKGGFRHLAPQTNLISTGVNPKINFMSVF